MFECNGLLASHISHIHRMYKAMRLCVSLSSVSSGCDVNGFFFCRGNNNVFGCFLYFHFLDSFWVGKFRLRLRRGAHLNGATFPLNEWMGKEPQTVWLENKPYYVHIKCNSHEIESVLNWMYNVQCTWSNSALKNWNVSTLNVQCSIFISDFENIVYCIFNLSTKNKSANDNRPRSFFIAFFPIWLKHMLQIYHFVIHISYLMMKIYYRIFATENS